MLPFHRRVKQSIAPKKTSHDTIDIILGDYDLRHGLNLLRFKVEGRDVKMLFYFYDGSLITLVATQILYLLGEVEMELII